MEHVSKGYQVSKAKSLQNNTVEVIGIIHEGMDINNLLDDTC